MSRALTTIAALALAAATLGLVPEGAIVANSRASAADCAWQRHSKRVVKHLRRHGRVRRVIRQAHWWSCNPLAAVPATISSPLTLPMPTPAPTPEPEPEPRWVSVKAKEFSLGLSRPSVVAGEVTVELNNQGEDPHDLALQLTGGEEAPMQVGEVEPNESSVAHFDLSTGTYRLWCSLPQHDEWGMHVNLEVRAS